MMKSYSQKITAHALAVSVMRGGRHKIVNGADWLMGEVRLAEINENASMPVRLEGETRALDVFLERDRELTVVTFERD